MFNYFLKYKDDYLVYNTLNTNLYRINETKYNILKNISKEDSNNLNENSNFLLRALEEQIIVPRENEESTTAIHNLYKIIYANTMNITIIPTMDCNFKCIYCFEEHKNIETTFNIENAIINFIKKNIIKHRLKYVYISWFGGEPLLKKNVILNIMKKVKFLGDNYGVTILSDITTNGYLLDVNTFEQLLSVGILFYEITIDGFAETHDLFRPLKNGSGTYTQIVENLKKIKKAFPQKIFHIIIRTNIDKNSASVYPSFVKEHKRIFQEDSRFEFCCSSINNWGGKDINNIKKNLFDNIYQASDYINNPNIRTEKYSIATKSLSHMRCNAGKANGFVIMPNGELKKCVKLLNNENPQEIKDLNNIGHIDTNGNAFIDESKNARFITLPQLNDDCKQCCWLPICFASNCPANIATNRTPKCKIKNHKETDFINDSLLSRFEKKDYINL